MFVEVYTSPMNLESILDLALAIGRVVLALVFIGCILTLLMQ